MVLPIVLAISFVFLPAAYAEPTVTIIMEKTTYSYCEKLFYTIKVSEITGESAIIHIRDESGTKSSAIPIPITNLQNPIPSLGAFEREIYPSGKYFIDVEYSGSEFTAEFNLIDSDNICIPPFIKQLLIEWFNDRISDGLLMDAFQKYVDTKLIDIPFEINEENIHEVYIPDWVKMIVFWLIHEEISDQDFAHAINYLIDEKMISFSMGIENKI